MTLLYVPYVIIYSGAIKKASKMRSVQGCNVEIICIQSETRKRYSFLKNANGILLKILGLYFMENFTSERHMKSGRLFHFWEYLKCQHVKVSLSLKEQVKYGIEKSHAF